MQSFAFWRFVDLPCGLDEAEHDLFNFVEELIQAEPLTKVQSLLDYILPRVLEKQEGLAARYNTISRPALSHCFESHNPVFSETAAVVQRANFFLVFPLLDLVDLMVFSHMFNICHSLLVFLEDEEEEDFHHLQEWVEWEEVEWEWEWVEWAPLE